MAVTLTQSPRYSVAGRPSNITFDLGGGGNFVRAWVTDAPLGSELKTRLAKQKAARIEVHSGDAGDVWRFEPGTPGRYVIVAQEYTKGASTYGGGYHSDPSRKQTETQIGSESALEVVLGQRLTMPVGIGSDRATLVMYVWGDYVRETAFDQHGETSPAIIAPATAKAKTATLDAATVAALAALADSTASVVLGNPGAVAVDLIQKFNAHIADATPHVTAQDSANTVVKSYKSTGSPKGLVDGTAELLSRLRKHMQTDAGTGSGVGSGSWHDQSGVTADLANLPIASIGQDIPSAVVALADIWRSFEAHRVDTNVHDAADTTNSAAALPPLFAVHQAFVAALAKTSPTAAPTDNAGVTVLVHGAGMVDG